MQAPGLRALRYKFSPVENFVEELYLQASRDSLKIVLRVLKAY